MYADNLDDYLIEQLPPQDETEARAQAQECRKIFASPLEPARPIGQMDLDFAQQQEMFS